MYTHNMAVDPNSFTCKRPVFANKPSTFENLSQLQVFLSRGYAYPLLCCWDVLKRDVTVWVIWETAKGKYKAMLGLFQERIWASLFPGFLDAVKVLRGIWASMGTFSFATAFLEFSRNSREKPCATQPVNPPPWIVLGGAAPLDGKYQ